MANGAIASSILSALSAVISGISNYVATKKTNEQNQQNYEDWKDYNTPANQVQRLQDAGLNPYMINGVSNTLSQPFNVQNNTGISSLFSQLSSAASQASGVINQSESNEIKRQNLDLTKEGLSIRKQMAEIARKKGDAYAALLWSQGTIADLNANYWRDIADERVRRYKAETAIQEMLSKDFYPLKLGFYQSYYPELIANKQANTALLDARKSDLSWSHWFRNMSFQKQIEQHILDRITRNRSITLNNQLGWANLENSAGLGRDRINLQRDYYSLAEAKWLTGLGMSLFSLPFSLK